MRGGCRIERGREGTYLQDIGIYGSCCYDAIFDSLLDDIRHIHVEDRCASEGRNCKKSAMSICTSRYGILMEPTRSKTGCKSICQEGEQVVCHGGRRRSCPGEQSLVLSDEDSRCRISLAVSYSGCVCSISGLRLTDTCAVEIRLDERLCYGV